MPDHFYADDSAVTAPSRLGMGPLVAAGGIYVPAANVRRLLTSIDQLAAGRGLPDGEEFKWSPRRKTWMYENLTGESRFNFFRGVTTLCADAGVKAIVCVVDTSAASASGVSPPERDALHLLLERVNAEAAAAEVVVIMDQPGGNHKSESQLAAHCRELLVRGTKYTALDRIVGPPLFAESHNQRLLQVADVFTSCVAAVVGGRTDALAVNTFAEIAPLLRRHGGLIRGAGLKIHPDARHGNLYRSLVDTVPFGRVRVAPG